MKKIIAIVVFMLIGISIYAQKSYVTVYYDTNSNYCYLSGSIPDNMKSSYNGSDFDLDYYASQYRWIGEVLNELSKNGFSVEQQSLTTRGTTNYVQCLITLSKNTSDTSTKIRQIKADDSDADDSEAIEIARYNLQGIPVKSSEKGLQIIVYSNYTTKTVLVQ